MKFIPTDYEYAIYEVLLRKIQEAALAHIQ
jgi:hypothetical protein